VACVAPGVIIRLTHSRNTIKVFLLKILTGFDWAMYCIRSKYSTNARDYFSCYLFPTLRLLHERKCSGVSREKNLSALKLRVHCSVSPFLFPKLGVYVAVLCTPPLSSSINHGTWKYGGVWMWDATRPVRATSMVQQKPQLFFSTLGWNRKQKHITPPAARPTAAAPPVKQPNTEVACVSGRKTDGHSGSRVI
jgi:hypothetical protein